MFCLPILSSGFRLLSAHEANLHAMGGRRMFATDAADRSRFWAKLALILGIISIIIAVNLYLYRH